MLKPEYFESEESWEQYKKDYQKTKAQPKEEPLSALRQAIAKARGDITCEQDMVDTIDFHNKLWLIFKNSLRPLDKSILVDGTNTESA